MYCKPNHCQEHTTNYFYTLIRLLFDINLKDWMSEWKKKTRIEQICNANKEGGTGMGRANQTMIRGWLEDEVSLKNRKLSNITSIEKISSRRNNNTPPL